jgi:hypothetical protein
MSVSDPGEKIEWGADSEPRKNERVPSSGEKGSDLPALPTVAPWTILHGAFLNMRFFFIKKWFG